MLTLAFVFVFPQQTLASDGFFFFPLLWRTKNFGSLEIPYELDFYFLLSEW